MEIWIGGSWHPDLERVETEMVIGGSRFPDLEQVETEIVIEDSCWYLGQVEMETGTERGWHPDLGREMEIGIVDSRQPGLEQVEMETGIDGPWTEALGLLILGPGLTVDRPALHPRDLAQVSEPEEAKH